MLATSIRMFAKRNHPSNRKAPPFHTPSETEEAERLSTILLAVLCRNGPLSVDNCWAHVQDTGFRSKRQMKLVLKWMKERHRVRVICEHLAELSGLHGDKEFSYAACSKGADNEKNRNSN